MELLKISKSSPLVNIAAELCQDDKFTTSLPIGLDHVSHVTPSKTILFS